MYDLKLKCTIEDEVRDYIREHDELRYSEFDMSENGFLCCKDNKQADSLLLSLFIDAEEILEILRWHRIEIKMRGEL